MTTEVKLPLADAQPNSIANAGVRRIQIGCWVALIAIAAVRAWFTRYELGPDSACPIWTLPGQLPRDIRVRRSMRIGLRVTP